MGEDDGTVASELGGGQTQGTKPKCFERVLSSQVVTHPTMPMAQIEMVVTLHHDGTNISQKGNLTDKIRISLDDNKW